MCSLFLAKECLMKLSEELEAQWACSKQEIFFNNCFYICLLSFALFLLYTVESNLFLIQSDAVFSRRTFPLGFNFSLPFAVQYALQQSYMLDYYLAFLSLLTQQRSYRQMKASYSSFQNLSYSIYHQDILVSHMLLLFIEKKIISNRCKICDLILPVSVFTFSLVNAFSFQGEVAYYFILYNIKIHVYLAHQLDMSRSISLVISFLRDYNSYCPS